MLLFSLALFCAILFFPSVSFAWGPLTHVYLGSEILAAGAFLPAGLISLLRKYRSDYLYGNLMADIIIGKKFLPEDRNPHSWEMALNLCDAAETDQQRAFVLGYMSHLAADTVAHNFFTGKRRNIGHTLVELRADSMIDKHYWLLALAIDRTVQVRNDLFLERSMERALFSFKTNKRIFRGMLLLSGLNKERLGDFIQRNSVDPSLLERDHIQRLHAASLSRMVDVLSNERGSWVLGESPMVIPRRPRRR